MKKLSAILCTLLAIAACVPQKASANTAVEIARATSTLTGFGLGSATLFAGMTAYAFSFDDPAQGKRATNMRLTILGCVAAGLTVSGCFIAMGNRDLAAKIFTAIFSQR